MTLILIRGIPGSGKSTFAKQLLQVDDFYTHLEADMWFVDSTGAYKWYADGIKFAHKWCQDTTRILLNNDQNVIVSNTFTTMKEMKPYLEYASDLGIEVEVYRMTGNYGSIHNVPEDAIQKMTDRFQDYPGEGLIGNQR